MLSAPMSIDINITNRCNLRCAFCSATPFHHTAKRDELTLTELSSLFDQIEDMGVFLVRLAGGEPLVRRDIKEILADLRRRTFDKLILTNGVFLDDEELLSAIVDAGMESIAISMDGHTAALHDDSRGVSGTFDKVLANLPRLRRAGIRYNAMSTVTSRNVGHLIDIVEFLDARGFDSVNFILLNFSGMAREGEGGHFSSWDSWRSAFLDLTHHLATERPRIQVSILPPHEDAVPYEMYVPLRDAGELELLESVWGLPYRDVAKTDDTGCAAGKTQLTIFENGEVFGCELMRDNPGFSAGNVRTTRLRTIWDESKVFQKLRSMRKRDLEGACGTCTLDVCGGGCRASAYNQTFSIDGSDTNCHLHRHEPKKRFLPVVA